MEPWLLHAPIDERKNRAAPPMKDRIGPGWGVGAHPSGVTCSLFCGAPGCSLATTPLRTIGCIRRIYSPDHLITASPRLTDDSIRGESPLPYSERRANH